MFFFAYIYNYAYYTQPGQKTVNQVQPYYIDHIWTLIITNWKVAIITLNSKLVTE